MVKEKRDIGRGERWRRKQSRKKVKHSKRGEEGREDGRMK